MSETEAATLAKEVVNFFANIARFLTYPIGAFGGVIAIVDSDQIGLLTIFDED